MSHQGSGLVRLRDGNIYVGVYKLHDGWVILTGRRRHRANGGLLYSSPATWTWPARQVVSIKADAVEEVK